MNYTAIEREAVLTYDEESNQYHIFCSSGKEQTRMRKAGFEAYKEDAEGNKYYRVERNQISFRAKSDSKRVLSPERRAALAANLAKGRANKKKLEEEKS
ncbi:hypothetical protein [Paenibacillus sp. FSL E2-0178]|uniref:hypothetical protein n=1 Tax=Paenibacillus sp. FSL E2-0178 TaxID=2921361 RepID=UPI00315827BF